MPDKEEYLKDAREEFDYKINLMIDDGAEELAKQIHQSKEIAQFVIDSMKEARGTENYKQLKEKFAQAELPSYVEDED